MNTKFKQTEIGKVPKEWGVVKVEDIFEVYGGTTPSTSIKEYWNGDILWVTPTDVTNLNENLNLSETEKKITERAVKESSLKVLQPGTLLLTSRATIGFTAINSRPVTVNQGMAALIKRNENTNNTFYAYYFSLLKDYLKQLGAGSTFKEVSKSTIKKIKIPLPPLPEQRHIAEILSTVDQAIQRVDEAIARTERLKRGLMQRLLTRGIGHREFKFSKELGHEIPKEWKHGKLVEFSMTKDNPVQTGPFGAQLHASDYVAEGVPLILIKSVLDGRIIEEDMPRITETKTNELSRYRLKPGDIVFSRVGSVGRAAVIKEHQKGWLVSGQMLRVRLENPQIDNNFLSYVIDTNWFKKALASRTVGATRKSINTKILSNLPLVVPPYAEQRKIVKTLSAVDKKLELERNRKEKLERIKRGLMNDLLTGKVRVKLR